MATAQLGLRDGVVTVGSSTTVAASGRNSGNSLHLTNVQGGIDVSLGAQATWVVGFAYKIANFSATRSVLSLFDGTVCHVTLAIDTAGNLRVYRNTLASGTLLATGTTVLTANTFAYLELLITISDTVGVVQAQINGDAETFTFVTGTSSTQDTRNGGNATANIVSFGGGSSSTVNVDYDDVYIHDGSGGVDDTFWGDVRLIAKSVDGAGNHTDFTPSTGSNWQNVDDATPDDDATYNESSTVNHIDSMTTAALGVTGTVKSVGVSLYARKTDAGAASLAPLWRISGTDYAGTGVAASTDYRYKTQLYRVSPATSSAWTTSEIDGAEVGYKRTA